MEIIPVKTRSQLKQFIRFPWQVYKNDPDWVPPLLAEEKKKFDFRKNPFFEHAEAQYFLAVDQGQVLGRICAHIDHLHNQTHNEKTGFFGFFESGDDAEIGGALLSAASQWLKERGMEKIRGPLSFSLNEEAGCLVNGFGGSPFVLLGHNPQYYPSLYEQWGLEKVKDLYCWRYDSARPVPEAAAQISEAIAQQPGVKVREISIKNIESDLRILIDIFNEAWQKNWGFVPLTESEIKKAAEDFKLILEPKLALIAEVHGKPAAIALAIPNLNEAIKDLNGRLFPTGLFKLLYRIKTKKIKSARLVLLGIKKEYRNDILSGLSVLLYTEMHRRSQELKHWGGELSWTLEDNAKINNGISLMGGEHYKTYRIYEKKLAS